MARKQKPTPGMMRVRVSLVDRIVYFLRSRGAQVVVLALVANTMVAQLLYNSAGQLVLSNRFLLGYLIFSAVCSTVAFALFEISTIFQLHDLMALDASIKNEIEADKLIKRGCIVLAISSLINFLSVLYFLALAWHTTSGHSTAFPLDHLPQPWNWGYYALHALAYTAVLFLAGIFGERPKSGKEVILATQRALEQQALESWQLQKQAQIEELRRRGEPLGAIAAALASPETAERIAILEAATNGQMSALDAARLNMQRAGHDLSLLEGLRSVGTAFMQDSTSRVVGSAIEAATELLDPLAVGRR
jgi:stage V sporulation protein SpoVS